MGGLIIFSVLTFVLMYKQDKQLGVRKTIQPCMQIFLKAKM